jgi:H+/gluconate symporter-like permease
MGLLGILVSLGLLIWLAYRGWSVLILAPAAALIAAAFAGEPLLAHWTQTFMVSAARFVGQFFPLFLLGALFGKLMEDSGSVEAIARFMTEKLGPQRASLAVVLAGALVTYGGVSLFVAFFVFAPMALAMFKAADIPRRLMPAAIMLGSATFTMSALPGSPAIQNAIPMPFFGTTPFAAPGLGIIAAVIMLGFGLWWLGRAEVAARRAGEGFGGEAEDIGTLADDELVRERATVAQSFDPAEIAHGQLSKIPPPIGLAALPPIVVIAVNLLMSFWVLPRIDASFLAEERWGKTSLTAVGGVWAVIVALAAAIAVLVAVNRQRLPSLRKSIDAGANASVLPAFSVASLVGFGAVVAALPAFGMVRDWVLSIGGGPLVSLAVATNLLAALTGSASGGLTIALDALGATYMRIAAEAGIDPAIMHRVAGAGVLDSLPHNGAVVTLLAVCGATHSDSYFDIVMVAIVGPRAANHGRGFRHQEVPRLRADQWLDTADGDRGCRERLGERLARRTSLTAP